MTTALFLFLFSLVLSLILIYITSFYTPKTGRLVKKHWPIAIIVLITLSLAVSLPLNSLAKEMVVNQDSFQVYLKITEVPLKPSPVKQSDPGLLVDLSRFIDKLIKKIGLFRF